MTRLSGTAIGVFLLLFIVRANAQDNKQGFQIKGTIKGVDSGVVRMLAIGGGLNAVDSATITNGKFTFRGKTGSSNIRAFTVVPGNWIFRGIVEDTLLTFEIDTAGAMHQRKGNKDYPMIWQIKQTGSKMGDVYARYEDETGPTYFITLFKQLNAATGASDIAAIRAKLDSVRQAMGPKQKAWIENYIHQYPTSVAGIFIFKELYEQALSRSPSGYLQSVLVQFSGAAKASAYYKDLADLTGNLKNNEANTVAPDFTLEKRDKTKFTLSTTRGGYTMIDFWASWCVPCRAAIPNWKKVYAKYHPKGFNMVSVSIDDSWKNWLPALDKEKMPWVQVIDERSSKYSKGKVSELFPSPTIPFYVLLDKEGKVLLASGDEEAMNKKLAEVLP
ncbi:AhpC/TSA family protein [Mucilaginibacter sp. HC2]|uniref:TlpA disulfide reductase family protein n=1 Tax=Mucilaginibacter inviolabilis TaxID=2714892 RepID=UPI00140871A4|nr:TlpA disulfide reductase family protein [Mucilaginibacter inviolabilis]NHA04371.1 AhpC/TSA family protein [Mucilaginibacter inviolabilis]